MPAPNDTHKQDSQLIISDVLKTRLESRPSVDIRQPTADPLGDQTMGSKTWQHLREQQYLSDELKAWKEMVEHQKAIMEKIRSELEKQQTLNREKDITIESLRNLQKLHTKSGAHEARDVSSVSTIDETVADPLAADDNEFTGNSPAIFDRTVSVDVWTTDQERRNNDDNRYGSDESLYSGDGLEKMSPISMPEELLVNHNRVHKKVFIPYSHEGCSVREHLQRPKNS
ncbi:unnamed protein product, partial [Medioppia subpectinata]